MNLSDLSIRNPAFPVMLCAAMMVFGYLGYREMGISQFPEIDFPVITITTAREGASPDIVDGDVTDVIEDAVSAVEGIDFVGSESLEGMSVVTVNFQLYRDIDAAMQDVQNAVSAAMSRLPLDIDPPVIRKMDNSRQPVLWLAVHGTRPLGEIAEIIDGKLKQAILTLPGCGGINIGGLRDRSMRIWLDREKLHAHNLDVREVADAIGREHVERPAGYLESNSVEINVRTLGEAVEAEDFESIVIAQRDRQLIRLKDVAIVEKGLGDRRSFARFDGEPSIGIGVQRAMRANVVELCDAVRAKIPELQAMLPPGMTVSISNDWSLFIKDDVAELKVTLVMGVVLTSIVMFLFLGSLGTTFNILLSIPTSLLGTFCVLHYLGFTVNLMTLLALSLSVGVVVDDAILVLENIYRRAEMGQGRMEAARHGAHEITFAAMAATFSIIAIFLPVAFLEGVVGRYFFQFGITVSVAVFFSLITSLTLTPMLCAYFMRVRQRRRPLPPRFRGLLGWPLTASSWAYWLFDRALVDTLVIGPVDWVLGLLGKIYSRVLHWSLRLWWGVVAGSLALFALAFAFLFGADLPLPSPLAKLFGAERLTIHPLGSELIPSEDQSRFIATVICPVGMSIDYVDQVMAEGEVMIRDMPEIAGTLAAVSSRPGRLMTEGNLMCRLVPSHQRTKTQAEVIDEVRRRLGRIPGVRVVVMDMSTQGFSAGRGFPIDFAVQGPNWDDVTEYAQQIMDAMRESGAVTDVNSDYRPGMSEVQVVPDRKRAADLAVPMSNLAYTINALIGGVRVGRFTSDGRRFDVRLRLLEQQRASPFDIQSLYLKSDEGKLVSVADVTKLRTVGTLPVINRYNHQRKVEITANMAAGVSQGEAIAECRAIAEEILPQGYSIVQLGNAQAMEQTIGSLTFAIVLGAIVAYMVLGAQFNSFLHPITVLMAMPFAATGALATLWYLGDTLNLMSMIGIILLMGLVKKNSIILVDFTNQLRASGMETREAVLTACPVRLRPILMTSVATIAAAVPLAAGFGPGAETRAPLARGIIGGIVLSTAITLIVVPVFYVLTDRFVSLWRRKPQPARAKVPSAPEPPPMLEPVLAGEPDWQAAQSALATHAPAVEPKHRPRA